ncbi:hypothetical protein [Escherichia coli]|uniref:hypothetical protein n=1 Tax=Escherichia coli TaxID=562 RepID=UPI000400979D|nr:hypothetical protein [Escherichia coli]MCG4445128.1 hypothetical protein [Escherichia coli]MCN2346546.1 hypothetical protein [Escherichia coli]MCN5088985.1 hypothetical protein [Escherichia coli]MDA5856764.1 hypothetical protein [Escherichia coli]WIX73920.1 hypothetical protein QRM69_08495 [Escherichia coli]
MAEGMIKDLVASGHALADDMTGAPSVLVRCLAAQLEVQLVRANELAEDHQRAIESIKQADAAVKLAHEKFSTLAAENAGLKAICDDRRRFIMNGVQMGYIKVPAAETDPDLETIRIAISPQKPIPATDAFLTEIERKAIRKFINSIEHILRDKLSPYDTEEMLETMRIFLEEQGGEQK